MHVAHKNMGLGQENLSECLRCHDHFIFLLTSWVITCPWVAPVALAGAFAPPASSTTYLERVVATMGRTWRRCSAHCQTSTTPSISASTIVPSARFSSARSDPARSDAARRRLCRRCWHCGRAAGFQFAVTFYSTHPSLFWCAQSNAAGRRLGRHLTSSAP